MGFPAEENIQQAFQLPNRMGFQQNEEQENIEYEEEAKKFKGRTVQDSKYKKTYSAKDNWKDKGKSQEDREYPVERNRTTNLAKLPPRLEGTTMIDELQKVGFNTRTNQEEKHGHKMKN